MPNNWKTLTIGTPWLNSGYRRNYPAVQSRAECPPYDGGQKIGKPKIVLPNNRDYGIQDRQFVSLNSKACDLDFEKMKAIEDQHLIASLKLARAFGLRKEEAIKFIPRYADQGDSIRLKASWCKGGRARTITIQNQEQRSALDFAHKVAGSGSLIPAELQYHQQGHRYDNETKRADLKSLHGLRHRYAQLRYEKLTGWKSPHAGGPERSEFKGKQVVIDREARRIITEELGHSRLQITVTYLG